MRSLVRWIPMFVVAVSLSGYVAAPFEPYSQEFVDLARQGPQWPHVLGVDELGQDAFSRVWVGMANTLVFAGVASFLCMFISGCALFIERRIGGLVGQMLRSLVAVGIAIPSLFMGLILMIFLERSPIVVSLAIAIATTPLIFRQMRTLWLEQRNAQHIEASYAIGGSALHLFRYAIAPNLIPQLFGLWKIAMAIAMLELSAMTFLGLSGDPNWAELGSLLRFNQKSLLQAPMLVIWPGVALCGLLALVRSLRIGRE